MIFKLLLFFITAFAEEEKEISVEEMTKIPCDLLPYETGDIKLSLVLFTDDYSGQMFEAYKAVYDMEKYKFFTTDAFCAKEHSIEGSPALAIFRNFEDSPVAYTGPVTEAGLRQKMNIESYHTFFEMDVEYITDIFHEHNPVAILMLEGNLPIRKVFFKAAKELKGKILFSFSAL